MRNRKLRAAKNRRPLPWSVSAGSGLIVAAILAGMARRSPEFHWPLLALAVVVLLASFVVAMQSAVFASRRGRLLDGHQDLASIKKLSWQDFELIVSEAYRRLGYAVEEVGQGGADGGVDLVLSSKGKKTLVQCKRWNSSVGAPIVREMFGLMVHHGADAVKIVCASGFTKEARAFSTDKAIELVDGEALVALVRSVRSTQRDSMTCLCGAPMKVRQSKGGGDPFLGCTRFPDCRVTRPTL
ncbi:restriction endonuclease [Paraburkholderia sp. A1RI-2L]|uniref:restriction endonuclease n=1 Tax=Paraburkholderia sp. A1RI-2L TaxID=3028367 RepID=UPI003B784B11